ncbi:MAG: response regulator [Gemmatimonadaceae bacterium]
MASHVLVVEDSALVTNALRLLLEVTGHRVSVAANVRDAVTTARTTHPDVMLLDVTLQQEDGLDVLRELERTGDAPRVSVALTGHDAAEVRERCLAAGCREVLLKPVSTAELTARIDAWLAE